MTAFGVRTHLTSPAAQRIAADARRLAAERIAADARRLAAEAAPPPPVEKLPALKSIAPLSQCHRIIEEVSRRHDIPVGEILSDSRARVLIPARHEAIFRCVAESPLSLPSIGRIFNRDHTSIGYAVMKHHLRTGERSPRGMDWILGGRKRHQLKNGDA